METELRHTERSALFLLLRAKETGDIDEAIAHLSAAMEPEDIERVQYYFAKREESK